MSLAAWGPRWPNCDRSNIVTLIRADGLRLPVHRELAGLVSLLMDLTELHGYNIRPDWTWGYACRPIAGTSTASNHSQGTAVDINAPVNPRRRPLTTNLPKAVVQLWKDHGFVWGGDYRTSTPDPMHFEVDPSKSPHDMWLIEQQLRAFLRDHGGQPSGPPIPREPHRRPTARPYPGLVRMGDQGADVRVWQTVLVERGYRIAVDGDFGPATNHVMMDWQRKHRLHVDGIGGEATWHSLLFA